VRFDNAVMLDAARLAAACHAQGALLSSMSANAAVRFRST